LGTGRNHGIIQAKEGKAKGVISSKKNKQSRGAIVICGGFELFTFFAIIDSANPDPEIEGRGITESQI